MAEPIRILIADCDIQELRDIWIELGYVMRDVWDSGDKKLWRRLARIRNWIELDGKYRAYRNEPRELTDNEFIAMVAREFKEQNRGSKPMTLDTPKREADTFFKGKCKECRKNRQLINHLCKECR